MSLAKGTMLGPYEVDILLGAGGMGEVYRARDTRLDRTVAIKVLLPDLTAGSDRRARFEREARAISALSNPHICALYDVGRVEDTEYLVMEYIEGETLADRIARGRLPVSQVLRYGTEIALALQHAHRAGITHRDLKPGNVMITASGVKLLDFGLAKLTKPDRKSEVATMVNPITGNGMIVGTVVYMSPEQLEGKALDHRTDIFSLGCILYEMATGQRPFGGSSRGSIMAAILSADPIPLRSLQPASPPALERIILTSLEKNADDRWQTAQDVARQLRWLSESSTSVEALPPSRPALTRRGLLIALPIAMAIGGLLAWGGKRVFLGPPMKQSVTRLDLSLPEDIQSVPSPQSPNFALSPDGRTICFLATLGGAESLFLRRLDSLNVVRVEGSENAWSPFWSSDGEWIGFSARGKLWKTRIGIQASPAALCDVGNLGAVASWVGNTILFADRPPGRSEIFRISDRGGTPVRVTTLKAREKRHAWPRLLSDGRHFVYQVSIIHSLERQLVLASLDSPQSSALLKNVSQAVPGTTDELLYVRDARLLAQRFDLRKGVMLGEPSLLADDVAHFSPSGRAEFDAANGVIVYRTDTSTGRLVKADRKGLTQLIDARGPFMEHSLAISNDGKRAAVTVVDRATGLGDIWIYDLARGVRDRFTNEPGLQLAPVWSPDGRSIVYSSAGADWPHLVRRALTGSTSEVLMPPDTFQFAGSFSPDGSTVFFYKFNPQTKGDIFRLDLRTRKAEPVLNSSFNEYDPQASPDGKWLAFSSDATGADEIYLLSLTGDTPLVRISTNGGTNPCWRRDGRELFYVSPQKDVIGVVPRVPGEWNDTSNAALFRLPDDTLRFAAGPDGQSFLFITRSHRAADSLFHLILGRQ